MRFEAGIANCEIKDINNLLHFCGNEIKLLHLFHSQKN